MLNSVNLEQVFLAIFYALDSFQSSLKSASFLIKVALIMYLFNFFLVNLMTFSDFKIAGLKQ